MMYSRFLDPEWRDRPKQALEINLPVDWMDSLYHLLKTLPQSEFRTVDALLFAIAGNAAGCLMLRRLLKLLPRSKRTDGAVYKSALEWKAETGLSKSQIERLNKFVLPRCGVQVTVKKAKGAPTNHYTVNGWAFLQRMSDVLGLPAYVLLLKMQENGNGFPEKREMDFRKTGKSLTIESTIKTTNKESVNAPGSVIKVVDFKSDLSPGPSPLRREGSLPQSTPEQLRVIDLLVQAGLWNSQAVSFALLSESIVRDCISSSQQSTVKKPVAYLISALRKQLQAHKPISSPPPDPLPIAAGGKRGMERFLSAPLPEPKAAPAPQPVNERLQVLVCEGYTAQRAWDSTYQQLELQLDGSSFNTWLRNAVLVDYEADCFVVRVHSSYARDMLQHRLYRNVARILRDVTGHEVEIRFEAGEATASPDFGLKRFLAAKIED